ncbi:hypothetical protein CBS101457_006601 [Exobasidium rhododendri]|nr:hypothetical protein CBS101457_006601 [Exobasidium rhododendri]
MTLQELTSEPVFMTIEEHSRLQEATPTSFEGHAPVLRLKLGGVRCCFQPETAFQPFNEASGSSHSLNGSNGRAEIQQGTLWVTESHVSFLLSSGRGFTIDYPTIALHAVSRTIPPALEDIAASSSLSGCLYCQLEGAEGDDEEEDEDQSPFSELWILPADQDSLEPLFEALSYCASLHPSGGEAEDEGGGNPFAGVGPFGTGVRGEQDGRDLIGSEGAFDDAEEDERAETDVQLSDIGRARLAHLDSLLDANSEVETIQRTKLATISSPTASFHSSDPRKAHLSATNSLTLVHLPDEIFSHPPLAASLLDLLHAFGDLASWTPLPSFGRASIVYKEVEGAQRAKEALDRLLLPLVGDDEEDVDDGPGTLKGKFKSEIDEIGTVLRAYFGPMTMLSTTQEHGDDHLAVPTTDRNFLISPPGSPPVGWEPIKEDAPNRETLADDLIRALGSLRDKGLGVQGHQPKPLREKEICSSATSPDGLLPPPSVVIPPSQATVRSRHPLAQRTYDAGDVSKEKESTISIPGVIVQSMDQEDGEEDILDERMNKGLSISSVKATVDSMRGSTFTESSSVRITPTGRPPLA